MFGTDFSHIDNEWPNSHPVNGDIHVNVTKTEKAKTWSGNAAAPFRPGVRPDDGHGQFGGAIRNALDELKIHVSTKPVSFGLRSSALSAPARHIQLRISCWPLSSTASPE
jgi:hypothetical protein